MSYGILFGSGFGIYRSLDSVIGLAKCEEAVGVRNFRTVEEAYCCTGKGFLTHVMEQDMSYYPAMPRADEFYGEGKSFSFPELQTRTAQEKAWRLSHLPRLFAAISWYGGALMTDPSDLHNLVPDDAHYIPFGMREVRSVQEGNQWLNKEFIQMFGLLGPYMEGPIRVPCFDQDKNTLQQFPRFEIAALGGTLMASCGDVPCGQKGLLPVVEFKEDVYNV